MTDSESAGNKQTETCERCGDGEVSARVIVQADYDDAMQATYRICNDCVGSLGEWYDASGEVAHHCLNEDCDYEGEPEIVDYYGADMPVCPRCETEMKVS